MGQWLVLVWLFWQQLVRRKSLWIIVGVAGIVVLLNITIAKQMEEMRTSGVRYDVVTRRAVGALGGYAEQMRTGALFLAILAAALVAPPSRKDGTTQFVLTLSVGRIRLALAQFGALCLFLLAGTLVLHIGYTVAAWRLGAMGVREALFAWVLLLVPLLIVSAASFTLSLTRPALLVYAIFLGVPYMLLPPLEAFVASWSERIPAVLRIGAARFLDNWQMLFPRVDELILWPHLTMPSSVQPPHPNVGLEVLQSLAATALWITIGLWSYWRHEFGSRTPTR